MSMLKEKPKRNTNYVTRQQVEEKKKIDQI